MTRNLQTLALDSLSDFADLLIQPPVGFVCTFRWSEWVQLSCASSDTIEVTLEAVLIDWYRPKFHLACHVSTRRVRGRTGPPGYRALARWAGCSAATSNVEVGQTTYTPLTGEVLGGSEEKGARDKVTEEERDKVTEEEREGRSGMGEGPRCA